MLFAQRGVSKSVQILFNYGTVSDNSEIASPGQSSDLQAGNGLLRKRPARGLVRSRPEKPKKRAGFSKKCARPGAIQFRESTAAEHVEKESKIRNEAPSLYTCILLFACLLL